MVTPQQFLESFLQEKASVYAQANLHLAPVYAKYFGEPLSQRAQDFMLGHKIEVVVEDVKQAADSASAIIRDHFKTGDIRTRYHLASFGETWKIVRVDRECLRCRATGSSKGPRCPKCGGEGWYDTSRDAA